MFNKKQIHFILLYATHTFLWILLNKVDLPLLYFTWGVVVTNWYINIKEK